MAIEVMATGSVHILAMDITVGRTGEGTIGHTGGGKHPFLPFFFPCGDWLVAWFPAIQRNNGIFENVTLATDVYGESPVNTGIIPNWSSLPEFTSSASGFRL